MTLPVSGQVGPSNISDGVSTQPFRQGKASEMMVSEMQARYYELAYRSQIFQLSVSAAAAITAYVGAAGGTPQIAAWNPAGSGKNLVLLQAGFNNIVAASAAGTVAWGVWWGPTVAITQATKTTPVNTGSGGVAGSVATGFTNVALTASTALTNMLPIGYYYWATAAGAFQSTATLADFGGSVLIAPGSMVALGGSAALTSATWVGSLVWAEVAI